jgi:hypothetical protein
LTVIFVFLFVSFSRVQTISALIHCHDYYLFLAFLTRSPPTFPLFSFFEWHFAALLCL